MAGGYGHTVAIRADGTLWSWGRNQEGQLGDGTTTGHATPAQVGSATTWATVDAAFGHTVAVRTNGTLWAWGLNDDGELGDGTTATRTAPVQIGSDTTWRSVAVSDDHSLATRTNGTLWTWGANAGGQLGDGTTTGRTAPASARHGADLVRHRGGWDTAPPASAWPPRSTQERVGVGLELPR